MFFRGLSHDTEKELNQMKRIVRALSACAVMLLIGWYCIPQVYHLLHLPDVVEQKDLTSAPTLELRQNDARFVRESGDERLDRTVNIWNQYEIGRSRRRSGRGGSENSGCSDRRVRKGRYVARIGVPRGICRIA